MSALEMKKLVEAQNVWDSSTQAAAMTLLAWFHSEQTGYASVSFGRIARWCGLEKRYVILVMAQLELEKEACVNIGPDPEQGGRNRWTLTIDQAIAKARRAAGVGDDVPLARMKRRRVRQRPPTGVIQGSPGETAKAPTNLRNKPFVFSPGDPGITPPVILGSPPGDPGITPPVILGSPQSAQVIVKVQGSLSTAADAVASAASSSTGFQLIGEAHPAHRHDKAAKAAAAERRSKLYHRIVRHARWLLEHPVEAAALNAGVPITTESDLLFVTKERCRVKRIPGYAEGDALECACRSEWYLFGVRAALNVPRLRDLRTNPSETTRGTRRRRR